MSQTQQLEALIQRLEAVASRLESGGSKATGTPSSSTGGEAPVVTSYDEYVEANVAPFLAICRDIGGDLNGLADLVEQGFKEVRNLIVLASKAKKPSDADFPTVVKPLADLLGQITNYKDSKRKSEFYNHCYAVDEGIKCLAWVTVDKTPVAYTKEMVNAAQFYNNKVLVAYKQKDKRHVEFVEKFKNVIEELANYIKEHHTTGLKWNQNGGDWKSVSATSAKAPSAPSSGGPPPPPPGPPPKIELEEPQKGGGSHADLFAAINAKRDNAGAGLRKVSDEEKTKNRKAEDKISTVPLVEKKTTSTTAPTGKKTVGPPKFELVQGMGEKWLIENQVGRHDLVIDKTMVKQGVYILNCKDTFITVKGKVNGIIIDSCVKTAVVFDDAVSSVEMVNSSGIKVQVNGNVPTINVDKTDGVQIFLSKSSLGTSIITSKSSEMNLCIPNQAGDDYDEIVIPEQFESKWNTTSKKLETQMVTLNL
jgi:adenylyl cyclase-associated protein